MLDLNFSVFQIPKMFVHACHVMSTPCIYHDSRRKTFQSCAAFRFYCWKLKPPVALPKLKPPTGAAWLVPNAKPPPSAHVCG